MSAGTVCSRFHKAIELVGGRWTGAVLQVLMAGRARYCNVKDAIPQISDRMLSERLRELEAEGLVGRFVSPDPPIRVEYELTKKGHELQASLRAVAGWAEKWLPEVPNERHDSPRRSAGPRTAARRTR
jgi:DNA-binding HxlR family transcriptional regulator